MRTLPAALLAILLLALSPAAVGAATRSVTMDNSRVFQPPVITIARGDTVRWSVASNANTTHDVSSTGVHLYFQSPGGQGGMHHGQSYSFQFTSSGRFPYVCRIHVQDGMYGTVTVPVSVAKVPGSNPARFKVTVGSVALAATSSYTRVVQVDGPTAGRHWHTFTKTKRASAPYSPVTHGVYTFRSWLQAADGSQSNPTPGKAITF